MLISYFRLSWCFMSHFKERISLLRYPPFFTYTIAFLIAAIGNGMGYIAMSWVIVSAHTNVTAMTLLMASFWLPTVLLGPIAGVLSDRISRKNLITISNFLRAAIFIFFGIYLKYHETPDIVYFMMLCNGIAFTLFYSSAMAFVRELVPPKDLMNANSTIDIMYEVGNVAGMGCAGFVIAYTSAQNAILINGIAFLFTTLAIIAIPKKSLKYGGASQKQSIKLWKDFHDGLHYLRKHKKLLSIYTVQLLIFITFSTSPLLLLPFSKIILHANVKEFGIIEAWMSIGIITGGILMPWFSEIIGLFRTLTFFSFTLCISFLFFGYNTAISIAAFLYFLIGFSGAIWPLIITRAQNLTDINFQGRVQSTYNSLSGAFMLAFYIFISYISQHISIVYLYWIEVAITATAILFLIRSKQNYQ